MTEPSKPSLPLNDLDDVVHQRTRLAIMTLLHHTGRADFPTIRGMLELTAGNLSRHLAVLEEAELITIDKRFDEKRPRTWVSLTAKGRQAYGSEVAQLRALVESFDETETAG